MAEMTQSNVESTGKPVGSHSVVAKLIHWGFIGVFVFAVSKQVDEVEELESMALLQEEVVVAVVFLVLLLARFFYMHSTKPTVMSKEMGERVYWLARAVHLGLYVSLALIAITGLAIGALYWGGIKQGAVLDGMLLSHEIVFWISMNLMGVHIVGALYHRYKGDGIWNSMVPVWPEKTDSTKFPLP